jgi:hypothetical protein
MDSNVPSQDLQLTWAYLRKNTPQEKATHADKLAA